MKRPLVTALLAESLMSPTRPVLTSRIFWWFCQPRVKCGITRDARSAPTTVTSRGLASQPWRWRCQGSRRRGTSAALAGSATPPIVAPGPDGGTSRAAVERWADEGPAPPTLARARGRRPRAGRGTRRDELRSRVPARQQRRHEAAEEQRGRGLQGQARVAAGVQL